MNEIQFNSRDWDSIKDTIRKVNEIGCMQMGRTSEDEDIFFTVTKENRLKTEVEQKNGFTRINIYDPKDFSVEELFERTEEENPYVII